MTKNYIIFGASQGLGDAFAKGLAQTGDTVYVVSRSEPTSLHIDDGIVRHWLRLDVSALDDIKVMQDALQNIALDVVIYNVGMWEERGFEDDYTFDNDKPAAIATLINTNVTSAITYVQALLPNVRLVRAGKIIYIGSTAGLAHTNNTQVSFVASKFSLRGITNALREHVRNDKIAVTCINPGELAAEIPYEQGVDVALQTYDNTRIPVADIVALVRCIVSLSIASCVKEITIPAMTDMNA